MKTASAIFCRYLLLQLVLVNFSLAFAILLHLVPLWTAVYFLLIFMVPALLGAGVGWVAAEGMDSDRQTRLSTANGLLGVLLFFAIVAAMVFGGGRAARSVLLRTEKGISPGGAARQRLLDYVELDSELSLLLEDKASSYKEHHRKMLRHPTGGFRKTERIREYIVVPVVEYGFKESDHAVSLWMAGVTGKVRKIGDPVWGDGAEWGYGTVKLQNGLIAGEVVRDPHDLKRYRRAAEEAAREHGLRLGDKMRFIVPKKDFYESRRKDAQNTKKAVMLINLFFVLGAALGVAVWAEKQIRPHGSQSPQ